MIYADDLISYFIFGIVAFVIPGTLTIWNIYNCFSKKPRREKLISSITILLGAVFYMLLFLFCFEESGDWNEQVNVRQLHYSISSEYKGIYWIVFLGFIGYFILLFFKANKLPPLVSAISISMVIILNVLQIAYAIQIAKNVDDIEWILYIYHFNILLLSARVIYLHMMQQIEIFKDRTTKMEEHKGFKRFYDYINNLSKYSFFLFIILFFVVAIIEIIFVIAGQGIDAPIKAFTDTADWTFSKQIPPPPIEYDGHYLCTVAAGGHKKVVKPLRFGTRRGETIIVNRQLCIANAFEELIQERLPVFHKKIRSAYDTYGYPLSKHITNPIKADIVYYVMKPLEWFFLLVLYMLDTRPEKRISNQYILRNH